MVDMKKIAQAVIDKVAPPDDTADATLEKE